MSSKYFHSLRVSQVERLTNDSVSITFDVPDNLRNLFAYKAGQYITIQKVINNQPIRRSYSICSAPHESKLSVAVKKISGGVFSTYANEVLAVGDTIDVMVPTGSFIHNLDAQVSSHVVFFAAGSGITPIMAIIKDILFYHANVHITLFYGNRTIESIIFREELEALKNKYLQRLSIYHILSKEKIGTPLFYGRMDKSKIQKLLTTFVRLESVSAYMLCGPAEMIFNIKDSLEASEVSSEKVHFELFNTDGVHKTKISATEDMVQIDPAKQSKVSIKIDGDIFDFSLGYGSANILDAALELGADLPYACKGGVCSTCRAKLTSGEVAMEVNYSLEPDDLAAGYILLCQAHPRTSEIYIDFDQK